MAASTKFDPSPGSPHRPFYTGSQCESFTSASMQRYGSFRGGSENPVSSALPNVSRPATSGVMMGEVMNFVQNLHFDLRSVSGDNRCQRLVSTVLGVQPDEPLSGSVKGKLLPSSSWDEVKRAKASVREGSMRARERSKVFHHAISSFSKYLPNIHSRKRSRSEILSTEKSGSSSSCDRSLPGPNAGNKGAHGTAVSNVFEHEQQKLEERTKQAVPNKRTRTSLTDMKMDGRNSSLSKPLESVERNSATPRLATIGAVSGDILSSVSVDGWEKTRMKKKRSAIKADSSFTSVHMRSGDGSRETAQDLQQRPVSDGGRSRLQNSQGFRPGNSSGATKGDTSQQSSISFGPKADQDNASLNKKDRSFSADKERMKFKGINKPGSLEDFSSASPAPGTKLNASARAPRSVSVSVHEPTQMVNRVATPSDWEFSNCSNKLPIPSGMNGKRASSTTSLAPPAHWAGQRSQKNCRPARKPSFLSASPGNNEVEVSLIDSMSDVASIENGSGFAEGTFGESPKHIRLKGDHFSSTPLSESEDSANAEFKFFGKKCENQDDKPVHHVQKSSSLVPPGRKNKLVNGEETRDIIRKQSRTARSHMSAGSVAGVRRTAKQLRAANLDLDKSESKPGRPSSRKLSDRKAYTRQKYSALNSATELIVGEEDCNEELWAAARAVINPCHALSSALWKQMEKYFRSISDNDIAFLSQQENQGSFLLSPKAVNVGYWTFTNGCKNNESVGFTNRVNYAETGADHTASSTRMSNEITLCQRLLAALIPEEDGEALDSDCEDLMYNTGLDEGFGSNILSEHFLDGFQYNACRTADGQRKTSSMRSVDRPEYYMVQSPEALMCAGSFSSYGHFEDGILRQNEMMASVESALLKHDNMPIDRKLLFEIETARLFPEGLLDMSPYMSPAKEDEIQADINYLVDKYRAQVIKKDKSIANLLKLASKAKETYKKNFEACVLDQLVATAYGKYVASRSLKSSATSKAIKQAALAFVKRTLERCQMFENTGKSCFSEASFLDKFLSASTLNETHSAVETEGESAKPYNIITNAALEASIGSQKSPPLTSWSGQNLDIIDIYSSDMPRLGDLPSELTSSKDDALLNSRVKKRELSLDEVGRAGTGNILSSSTKGKRSERDREGKTHGREAIPKQGTARAGRASGEKKSKAKPKQRMTQLSASVNGLLGKLPETSKVSLSDTSAATSNGKVNEKDNFAFDRLDETEPIIDLSGLHLPGMDVLSVTDDLDGQGQDFDSWLNIEDDGLQDFDIMGLEIPMDDLSELNMMV